MICTILNMHLVSSCTLESEFPQYGHIQRFWGHVAYLTGNETIHGQNWNWKSQLPLLIIKNRHFIIQNYNWPKSRSWIHTWFCNHDNDPYASLDLSNDAGTVVPLSVTFIGHFRRARSEFLPTLLSWKDSLTIPSFCFTPRLHLFKPSSVSFRSRM